MNGFDIYSGEQQFGDISIIVRAQRGREDHLDLAMFSLGVQRLRPSEVVIVLQEKDGVSPVIDDDVLLQRWGHLLHNLQLIVHKYDGDGRTRALNLGLEAVSRRYIGFLDDDDVLYPNHLLELWRALQASGAAWAYGECIRGEYSIDSRGDLVLRSRSRPFRREGYSFVEHLSGNFIPIHSFLYDRWAVGDKVQFDEALIRYEDYEFILRLGSRFEPVSVPAETSEYRIRVDGSNSVQDGSHVLLREAFAHKQAVWMENEVKLRELKVANFGWWVLELEYGRRGSPAGRGIGGDGPEAERAQSYVDMYWDSTSWRLSMPVRIAGAILRLRRVPHRPQVRTVEEAEAVVGYLKSSTSWRLTAPVRALGGWIRHR